MFDWNRWLIQKEVSNYAVYSFLPSINKWPEEITETVRQIYDPYYVFPGGLREHRARFDKPKNFVADPLRNAPLFDVCQEVYFSGTVYHDAIEGALFELDLSFCLFGDNLLYALVLSEAKEMWRDGYINHVRVVYLRWLAKQFDIPEENFRRFPEQHQLNSLFYDFIEGQQKIEIHDEWRRQSKRSAGGYQNAVLEVRWPEGVAKRHQKDWEPSFAFCLCRNGPFIDMFSRPVLRPKKN